MTQVGLTFPLVLRAQSLGVLDGASALIVAPTATGKSHIGREAICRALRRGERGTHAYLVPYRALASEVYDTFLKLLEGSNARVRISTGDHRDPVRPGDADLIVATYESFASLLVRGTITPGVIVADEIQLIADDHRGPVVEGLLARLLASGRTKALCGLSAVVENGQELADWLGIPLVQGTAADRPVALTLRHRLGDDLDSELIESLGSCLDSQQALVFCSSRPAAEKTARVLAETMKLPLDGRQRDALRELMTAVGETEPSEMLQTLIAAGIAYHHAGLSRYARQQIEQAFRQRHLRILACTPTLAAGVNLPADLAIVRHIFRSEVVRGTYKHVLLPSGEILNMLGRAGRPYQSIGAAGVGTALVERRFQREPEVKTLLEAIRAGRGAAVESRLPHSFEALMRFALAVIVERGEAARDDVAAAFEKTLAHHTSRTRIDFRRSFEEDLMEDIPAYRKVIDAKGAIRLKSYEPSSGGVRAVIESTDHEYKVLLSVTGITCTCPAASQFYRGRICKHQACAIHALLFNKGIDKDARLRAIYNCAHVFARTLDTATLLARAFEILEGWRLIERVPSGWRATRVGTVAANPGFDLLLVRHAIDRVRDDRPTGYRDIALWAVADYLAEQSDATRWRDAVDKWLDEVDVREIKLPVKYRGDFERGLEDLSRVCLLYEQAALALDKQEAAAMARAAAGAVRYGVAPELVPLMALNLPQLGRARSRHLYSRGVKNVEDLANAKPERVADPRRAPEALVRQWIERAKDIHRARAIATADREEADPEFDEIVARFRLDPAALR